MALWGNNDNVSALGEGGAGVVSLDYDSLTITGTGSSFGTPGYAKTGDVKNWYDNRFRNLFW